MPKPHEVPDTIRLDAESYEIEAAAGEGKTGPRRIKLVAYTGAKINLDEFEYPVVIDLTGVEAPSQKRPIIRDHDGSRIVGHSDKIEITARNISVEGAVSGAGPDASEVLAAHDNGFPWQVSIGAKSSKVELVGRGQNVSVNGRQFSGPLYVVRAARLVEFSLLSLGADDRTSATIAATAAKSKGSRKMNTALKEFAVKNGFDAENVSVEQEKVLQLAYDAERRQQDDDTSSTLDGVIEAARSKEKKEGQIATLLKQYIDENPSCSEELQIIAKAAVGDSKATMDQVECAMIRAARPKTGAIGYRGKAEEVSNEVVEASICRAGKLANLEKVFSERTLELSHRRFKRGLYLGDAMLLAAHQRGHRALSLHSDYENILHIAFPSRGGRDIQASDGFSAIQLPTALSNVANKFALEGWSFVEQVWRRIVRIKPVKDFKTITSIRLVQTGGYQQVKPTGELHHGALGETAFTNKANLYGMILGIPYEHVVNDDLGVLTQVPKDLGRAGGVKLCETVMAEFMNNAAFFVAENNNYLAGTSSPDTRLSVDGLTAAEELFLNQTGEDGKPVNIKPTFLLVPTSLSAKAAQLMSSTEIRNTTASTTYPIDNPHAGKYQALTSAYLNNALFTGYSSTKWYLLADPNDVAVLEVVFLNGVEFPEIATVQADFDTMGLKTRATHSFGASKQDFRGGVAMKGAA